MIALPVILTLAAVLLGLWLVSVAMRDASIVDIFWGPGFVLITWLCAQRAGFALGAGWLLVALVSVWGLRLGVHLGRRNLGHGEDPRYQAMRSRIGPRFWWVSLFTVFGLQGLVMLGVSAPIQSALLAGSSDGLGWLGWLGWLGVVVWAVGFAFEAIGDLQLKRFKADPDSAGKVLDHGLWRYTRHPNYFGDATIWWGHYLIAVDLGAPAWTAFSPVLMTFLLMRVSGVPMLEASLQRNRPGYADYVRRTNAFFPGPPKQ